jgi:hypothetical protein
LLTRSALSVHHLAERRRPGFDPGSAPAALAHSPSSANESPPEIRKEIPTWRGAADQW